MPLYRRKAGADTPAVDPGLPAFRDVPDRDSKIIVIPPKTWLSLRDRTAMHQLLQSDGAIHVSQEAFKLVGVEWMWYPAEMCQAHYVHDIAGADLRASKQARAMERAAMAKGKSGYVDVVFSFGDPGSASFNNRTTMMAWRTAALERGFGNVVQTCVETRMDAFTIWQIIAMAKRLEVLKLLAEVVMQRTGDVLLVRNGLEVLSYVTMKYRKLCNEYYPAMNPRLIDHSRYTMRARMRMIASAEDQLRDAAEYVATSWSNGERLAAKQR